jgi:hypothetical protein
LGQVGKGRYFLGLGVKREVGTYERPATAHTMVSPETYAGPLKLYCPFCSIYTSRTVPSGTPTRRLLSCLGDMLTDVSIYRHNLAIGTCTMSEQ